MNDSPTFGSNVSENETVAHNERTTFRDSLSKFSVADKNVLPWTFLWHGIKKRVSLRLHKEFFGARFTSAQNSFISQLLFYSFNFQVVSSKVKNVYMHPAKNTFESESVSLCERIPFYVNFWQQVSFGL